MDLNDNYEDNEDAKANQQDLQQIQVDKNLDSQNYAKKLVEYYYQTFTIRSNFHFIQDSKMNSIEHPEWMFQFLQTLIQQNLKIYEDQYKNDIKNNQDLKLEFNKFIQFQVKEMMATVIQRFKVDSEIFEDDIILLKNFIQQLFDFDNAIQLFIYNTFQMPLNYSISQKILNKQTDFIQTLLKYIKKQFSDKIIDNILSVDWNIDEEKISFVEDYSFLYSKSFKSFSNTPVQWLKKMADEYHYDVCCDILKEFERKLTLKLLSLKYTLEDFKLISGIYMILQEWKKFFKDQKVFSRTLLKNLLYRIKEKEQKIRVELTNEIGKYVMKRFFQELNSLFNNHDFLQLLTSKTNVEHFPKELQEKIQNMKQFIDSLLKINQENYQLSSYGNLDLFDGNDGIERNLFDGIERKLYFTFKEQLVTGFLSVYKFTDYGLEFLFDIFQKLFNNKQFPQTNQQLKVFQKEILELLNKPEDQRRSFSVQELQEIHKTQNIQQIQQVWMETIMFVKKI